MALALSEEALLAESILSNAYLGLIRILATVTETGAGTAIGAGSGSGGSANGILVRLTPREFRYNSRNCLSKVSTACPVRTVMMLRSKREAVHVKLKHKDAVSQKRV